MTLIIGYIHSDSTVHLISDSAETLSQSVNEDSEGNEKFNSFGEIIESKDGKIVFESAQKIYAISNSILLSFAGESFEGTKVLEDLRLEIKVSQDDKISETISDFFKKFKPQKTEYIIGFSEGNVPKIFFYKDKGEFLTQLGSYVMLGSGSENIRIVAPLRITLEKFFHIKSHPRNVLTFITSLVQCCAINELSFQKGVGGIFNGATIFQKSVYWASDTCNILYSSKHLEKSEKFIVNRFNRDNATFITSPKIQKTIFFPNLTWLQISPQEWIEKWLDNLINLNSELDVHYFVFICFDRRIVTVVNKKTERFSKNISLNILDSNNVDFGLSSELLEKILTHPSGIDDADYSSDSFEVVFNYI